MSIHSRIRLQLFDYVKGELPDDEKKTVEAHLTACAECAEEAGELRSTMDAMASAVPSPSEHRTDEYWQGFAAAVERRVMAERPPAHRRRQSVLELIETLWIYKHPRLTSAGVAFVALIVALVIWKWPAPERPSVASDRRTTQQQVFPVSSQRVEEYFRKSKVLLIGLSNMSAEEAGPVDLSTEKRVSRELVHEARYLRTQPLDDRSARLIDDLQRILIELANMHEQGDLPNMEIIRGGIHKENLLFKIRMAEQLYDSASYASVQGHD